MLTVDEAAYTALRYWNETPFKPDVRLRTSSVEAVRSMVANGSGVAVLSDMVYRPWSLEGRRIETIQLKDPIPPMSVGLAWRKGAEISPAMRAVRSISGMPIRRSGWVRLDASPPGVSLVMSNCSY